MNLKFGRPEGDNFYNELSQRVNQYFRQNNISRNANAEMIIKTIVVMLAYFGPYAVIFLFPMPVWLMWALCVVMGIGLAGVGMGVMHDANHNSYSSIKWVNTLLGYTLNMVGGNRNNWIIQHNVKHHTFTNVYGEDDDIENGNLIRLSPHAEWSWHHRFQHFYSWFLYMFGTITWTTAKDFRQIFRYSRDKYIKSKAEVSKELTLTIISKVVYYGYMLFLPILFLDVPFYYVLIGYITHHFTAGIILTVTFQLAHVVENNQYISKHNSDTLEDSWAVHQVKTTANFARRSRILNWYLGGLNHQIEHHLFPNICHIHYRKLGDIVKKTAKDHGLRYNEHTTLIRAIRSHYRMLKSFSQPPEVANS